MQFDFLNSCNLTILQPGLIPYNYSPGNSVNFVCIFVVYACDDLSLNFGQFGIGKIRELSSDECIDFFVGVVGVSGGIGSNDGLGLEVESEGSGTKEC